jgi:2-amino-4-hydroxy-6-hydroxymethyldihydropteridine diphosphokinase
MFSVWRLCPISPSICRLTTAQVEFARNLCSNDGVNEEIFIALGSNMGDREGNLLKALAAVAKLPVTRITALSPFYDTEPVGGVCQDNFLNAVMRLSSALGPQELLTALLQIESSLFGRMRNLHWGPRSIDLDILFYGSEIINNPPDLLLPHPRIQERRFVLAPLADIAPEFIHPVCGKSVGELLASLTQSGGVTKI